MARNKHPEETVKLILETAQAMFLERSFENTSLQDIMDATHLSKGAIYHHFASKEEVFCAVGERISERNVAVLRAVRDSTGRTGAEKLREIFRVSIGNLDDSLMVGAMPSLIDNPKFLAIQLRGTLTMVAPDFIEPILREGMADGSIVTKHPRELAEAIMVLVNVWMNPLIHAGDEAALRSRCAMFCELMRGIGLDVMGAPEIDNYVRYCVQVEQEQS